MADAKLISGGELKQKLGGEEKEKYLLIDVRRPEERVEKGFVQVGRVWFWGERKAHFNIFFFFFFFFCSLTDN